MPTEQKRCTQADLKDILTKAMAMYGRDISVPDDPNASLADLGIDSMATVQIALDIESQFGVALTEEDLPHLSTVGSLIEYINRRLQQ